MLDGPAKGEKREFAYKQVRVIVAIEPAAKRILASFAGASSAAMAFGAPRSSSAFVEDAAATLPTKPEP
eukprot:11163344-Lingulodinium_polyedra.AAC.1